MYILNLFLKSYSTYLKSLLEYRPAFFTDLLSNIISHGVTCLGIYILLDKFKMIQDWSLYEVLFLFNLNLVSYALGSFVFRTPMYNEIEDMIRMGKFDIVLIRPVNSLIYTLLGRPTIAYFGHLVLGTVIFVLCFNNLDVQWSLFKLIFLIVTILGAVLIQASMYLIIGTLGFWIVRTNDIFGTFMWSGGSFIRYPVSIYSKFIQALLTFVIPFAFVNYYPAYFLLDKSSENLFLPILQYGTPVVGIVLFLLAYKFWTIGVRRYESTGS